MLTNLLKITMNEGATNAILESANGQQTGDPAKLAQALIKLQEEQPPLRFIAGADAIGTAEQVVSTSPTTQRLS
jgi:hypothetical protein